MYKHTSHQYIDQVGLIDTEPPTTGQFWILSCHIIGLIISSISAAKLKNVSSEQR